MGSQRAGWLLFADRRYDFTVHTGNGIAVVAVIWPGYAVSRFEFYPIDGKSFMLPLWLAYPTFNSVTAGWRMGTGETYKYHWHEWYRNLSEGQRSEYRSVFPPPDTGGWPGFYER